MRRLLLPLLLTGCWTIPEEVELSGTLLDGQDGLGLEGADIAVHSPDGQSYGSGTTGTGGAFAVTVPASSSFFLTFDGGGDTVPTSFTGLAGAEDLSADEGVLFVRDQADVDALRAEFAACPTAQDEGGVVEGVVRTWLDVDAEPEELPVVHTAWVTVWDGDDDSWEACYLDDEGNSLPDGELTGNTGRFAVFGLPEGPHSVEVSFWFSDEVSLTNWNIVRVPADGVVPMYPAWVELP